MANDPTIIIGSLNDEELKKGINSLVQAVEDGTNKMKKSFDTTIEGMKQKLAELGQVKPDLGGGASSSSEKRKNDLDKEKEKVDKLNNSYDQTAKTMQQLVSTSSAKNSMYNILDALTRKAAELRQQLTSGDNSIGQNVRNAIFVYKNWQVEIDATKQKIQELKERLQNTTNPNAKLGVSKLLVEQQERLKTLYVEQANAVNVVTEGWRAARAETKRMYDGTKAQITELIGKQNASVSATSAQATAAKVVTDEVKRQVTTEQEFSEAIKRSADALRDYFMKSKKSSINVGGQYVYADSEAATIEQQLAIMAAKRTKDFDMQANIVKAIAENEKAITSEIDKQTSKLKTYQRPETWRGFDVTRENMSAIIQQKLGANTLVVQWDEQTSSIKKLDAALKQYQETYKKMTDFERNSPIGRQIIADMQVLERKIKQLKQEMSRPLSFEVVKNMPTNTIDDMLQKLKALQQYKNGINLLGPNAQNEIKQIDDAIRKINKELQQYTNNTRRANEITNALARSWNYMKNRLAFYFTVGASTQFIKNLIEIRSQYEMNERALGILIGSAEYGTQVFQELSSMALVSPYTLIELSSAAKQLTAYDIAARDVVDTTRRLADMASAVGVPLERLTYALGQIKAYGYLNSRDARMFANAGIPLVKELSNYYTELEGRLVSIGDIYDRIKKKAIGFEDVMNVVTQMTDEGGRFFDFQAKMADTLKVRLANLTLAWNNMLNEIGASNQGVLVKVIGGLRDLFKHWKEINSAIYTALWTGGIIVGFRMWNFMLVKMGFNWRILNTQMTASGIAGARVANIFRGLRASMQQMLTSGIFWWSLLVFWVGSFLMAIQNANQAVKDFNKSIRDGAKTNLDDLNKFLEKYEDIRDKLYERKFINIGEREKKTDNETTVFEDAPPIDVVTAKDSIPNSEAIKVWAELREQIELSSRASDTYISKLLQISNLSERLRQGFSVLEKIKEVNAALKDIGDNTFEVSNDWSQWWNLWQAPDGLVENIKDATKEQSKLNKQYTYTKEHIQEYIKYNDEAAIKLRERIRETGEETTALNEDIQQLTNSILKFLDNKGFTNDADKINEVFSQVTNKIATENGLSPDEAFTFQLAVEEARSKAAKQALEIRLADEQEALKISTDENTKIQLRASIERNKNELAEFEKWNGRGRVLWQNFTKWMSEQHLTELREKFREKDAEEIAHLDFSKGEWYDWATKTADKFAKEHHISYDDAFQYLRNWVKSANQWSIFIPLVISTEGGGTLVDELKKYNQQASDAEEDIKLLEKRLDTLNKKQEKTKKDQQDIKRGNEELKDAKERLADAKEHGGEGKQEAKDAKAAAREAEKRRKAEERERKKREREAAKAQREAESELQKTLKNELSLIDKVRSAYQSLIKEGASHTDAIQGAISGYEATVETINKVFDKWGLEHLDLAKFAGISNPRELVEMLQAQLDKLIASGKVKPAEIKDLQVKINDLELDAQKFDLKKIKDGLDNELSKLKDEYEFALELDANPELGETFAAMIGLNTDDLPHDVSAYAQRYLEYLNKYLKDAGSDIQLSSMEMTNEELKAYEEMTKTMKLTEEHFELIKKGVMEIRDYRKKDISEQMSTWQTLLEKYSEYEYKISEIHRKAEEERKKARKANAPQWLMNAIDKREQEDVAKLNFEEFQKTKTWITATGDLAGLTNNALGLLINRLKEYIRTAKNLDPKNILKINKALRSLERQQRSNNPFLQILNILGKAKDRFDEYQAEIDETVDAITELEEIQEHGIELDDKQADKLKRLKELLVRLKEEQLAVSDINPSEIVEAINAATQAASQAVAMFDELAQAIGGRGMTQAAKTLKQITGILEKTGQGASMGAMFGGYGAAIGAIAGAAVGVITTFADQWSGNSSINYLIEKSELAVKRLQLAYVDLEHAMNDAYGTGIIGAHKLAAENKKAELAQLKRQLQLEKERKAKNRDNDKIVELETTIRNLEYEIAETIDEIVNTLLGISSVGDAAETLMDGFVEALKNGEDAMTAFNENIDEMITTMVKKMLVTKIIQPWFESQWNEIQAEIDKRTSQYYNEYEDLLKQRTDLETIGDFERNFYEQIHGVSLQEYTNNLNNRIQELENLISSAGGADIEDIKRYAELLRSGQPIMEENMKEIEDLLRSLGLIKDSAASSNLSALQQGIQGITEDTAGALEAYMNSVSQQVYLQSDLLTQIRDAVVLFNTDVQVATIGQILLQLQASYQVQMTIQSTLNGWSNPSGQAVRVELIQ